MSIHRVGSHLTLTYFLRGDMDRVRLPASAQVERADALWKTTCLEVFIAQEAGRYLEFNFAPSGQWAAYAFDGYRTGMAAIPGSPVVANASRVEPGSLVVLAAIDLEAAGLPGEGPLRLALSAVVEERGESKSYWALAHHSDKPDFHHPDSFVLELA